MAIQLSFNREWCVANNENANQGAFVIDELQHLRDFQVRACWKNANSTPNRQGWRDTKHGEAWTPPFYLDAWKEGGCSPLNRPANAPSAGPG